MIKDDGKGLLEVNLFPRFGKHCFVAPWKDGKALKVFSAYPLKSWEGLRTFYWGDSVGMNYKVELDLSCLLIDAAKIQNICWMHGFAPRVYGLAKVGVGREKYWAQIVEDLKGDFWEEREEYVKVWDKVVALGKEYGFETMREDISGKDVIDGKMVDFNTFHFMDNHLEMVRRAYGEYGKYGKIYYQQIPELGMNNGPRDSVSRVEYMKLGELNFRHKTVLDLGCAGGFFCRYASESGADKVLGIEYKDCVDSDSALAARLAANELEYFDIDFEEMDLRVEKPEPADIVFFLSLDFHIGIPDWLADVTNEVCVFEANTRNITKDPLVKEATESKLKSMFRKVEQVGVAHDQDDCCKPVYWLYK